MKKSTLSVIVFMSVVILFSCSGGKMEYNQPVLGVRSAAIIEKSGLKFKDLNKNGKLDKYEDWRLSAEERSMDLLSQMSLKEKAGFMLTNTLNPVGSVKAEASGGKLSASDFDEGGVQDPFAGRTGIAGNQGNQGGNRPGGRAMTGERIASMGGSPGTTKVVKEFHNRHFIFRLNESAATTAQWTNKLQALCESEPLGIPSVIISNPRNHITTNASLGTSVGTTVFSSWPGELGLSAMKDLELVGEFADIARQEWLAVGIRRMYGYMADLSTEPRWSRVNGTFGEDADWVASMHKAIIKGFQGEKLSATSVAQTTKHFPGGGAGKGGQDSHFAWGKAEIYPGGMFENHLIPFQAAIDAGTAAIMPYYSLPEGTEYEEVGYAFNKGVINDLLRTKMGFRGIINSDTGPLTNMPWGVEDLTIHERYKKALEAGVNTFSGASDPADLIQVVDSGMIDVSLIDNSVLLLLKEAFELGLFENPYVNEEAAPAIVNNPDFKAKADLALRKSIVLLRNNGNILPVEAGTKIYFESLGRNSITQGSPERSVYLPEEQKYDVRFVKTPAEADLVLLWVIPGGNALFSRSEGFKPISLSLSKNSVDVEYIKKVTAKKPSVLVINYTNPWVIDEVYNENTPGIRAVLATFGTTPEALLDVITGRYNPTGKMPFATPVSDAAVENQKEDVPGYMEGDGYALFKYDEGLSYKVE